MKGWPPQTTFRQTLTLDTRTEHIVFTPFTRPDRRMVFDAAADSVTMHTLDGEPVETLAPARAGFKGMLGRSPWDAPHLGYFRVSCGLRGSVCISPATRSAPPRSWRSVAGRLVEPGPPGGCAPARGAPERFADLLSLAPFRARLKRLRTGYRSGISAALHPRNPQERRK